MRTFVLWCETSFFFRSMSLTDHKRERTLRPDLRVYILQVASLPSRDLLFESRRDIVATKSTRLSFILFIPSPCKDYRLKDSGLYRQADLLDSLSLYPITLRHVVVLLL